jgi:hAT family C-terminal dimerisation region
MISLGLIDECLQFQFFMNDINSVFDPHSETEKCVNDTEGDTEDDEADITEKVAKGKKKPRKLSTCSKMLQYIRRNKLESTFPNIDVALRIFECIPVSNASGERTFNGLKRVKSYTRSCLIQQHLNDLSTLFINQDITKSVNFDGLIDDFASSKSRKKL